MTFPAGLIKGYMISICPNTGVVNLYHLIKVAFARLSSVMFHLKIDFFFVSNKYFDKIL